MTLPIDLRRRALSCLLLGWVGPQPPAWLLRALEDGLGGVVLFGSNLGDGTGVARLTAQLRRAAGRDIVVALDEEGGDVTRLDAVRGSSSPGAAALGHRDDPDLTESVYRAIGARCAEAGVTIDLAPVADVNVDPRNPVIGVRAFSADPQVAARHVAAAVRGLESTGVAACLKHFPGHGATVDDSHHRIATVTRTRAELEATELPPFRAGIAAAARAVMTGHLQVAALDPDNIATFSRAITHGLLRGTLGFTGTVVTDALEMRAVADGVGMVEGAVGALAAGADAVETGSQDHPHLADEIPDAIVRAVDEGRLDEARLTEAAKRTAALAAPADTDPTPVPDAASVEIIGTLPRLDRPLVVECRTPGGMAAGELPWSLGTHLAKLLPGTQTLRIDDPVELPPGRDLVVVVRDPDRVQWQRALLPAATVVVDCGWPGVVSDRPTIRTRGVAPGLLAAAARALAAGAR
ncbi:MAG TPA: glycoside hydrolase family 3 N-terminal domain-containing protein [Jatrophihabitans sp.]